MIQLVIVIAAIGQTDTSSLRTGDLCQRVLNARQKITSGDVTVHVVEGDFDWRYHIRFDFRDGSRRIRTDLIRVIGGDDPKREESREVLVDDKYLRYSPDRDGPGVQAAISQPIDGDPRKYAFFDPRKIGMTGVGHGFFGEPIDRLLGQVTEANATVTEESGKRHLHQIECNPREGVTTKLWISPDEGYSLVASEVHFPSGLTRMDVTVAEIGNGIWFPTTTRVSETDNGKTTVEEITIEDAHFNEPIDPSVFTLEDLAMRPGTPLNEVPAFPEGDRVWDGEKFVLAKTVDSPIARRETKWLLAANLLAIVSAILWYTFFRLRARRKMRGI